MQVRDLISNRDSHSSSKAKSFRQPPRIRAAQFSASKSDHIDLVKQLGINVIILKDGRVKLIHDSQSAQSMEAAEEGAYFMQEMITLSQQQHQYDDGSMIVTMNGYSNCHLNHHPNHHNHHQHQDQQQSMDTYYNSVTSSSGSLIQSSSSSSSSTATATSTIQTSNSITLDLNCMFVFHFGFSPISKTSI